MQALPKVDPILPYSMIGGRVETRGHVLRHEGAAAGLAESASLAAVVDVDLFSGDCSQNGIQLHRRVYCAGRWRPEDGVRIKDLLGQVWRNSSIPASKFDSLKKAFILMTLAILPWLIAVALFPAHHPSVRTIITKQSDGGM